MTSEGMSDGKLEVLANLYLKCTPEQIYYAIDDLIKEVRRLRAALEKSEARYWENLDD